MRIRTETEAILGMLDLVQAGTVTLLRSAAHLIETEQNPYPDRQAHALNVLSLAWQYIPTSVQVAQRTQTYVTAGIGQLDALHLALAVVGEAAYFCTTDDRLLRRGREPEEECI